MTIQEIRTALRDENEDVRREAAESISSIKSVRDVFALYDSALSDESWRVRKVAVEGVLSLPDWKGAALFLISALESQDNVGKRNSAQEALVAMGEKSLPLLLPVAGHKDADVRKFLADILGDIGDASAAKVLSVKLLRDRDENVKVAAAEALGKIGKKDAIPHLLGLLRKKRGLILAYTALESLSRLGRKGCSLPIAPMIKGLDDPVLRKGALDALGWSRNRRAIPHLLKSLGDPNKTVREAGLVALVNLSASLSGSRREKLKESVRARISEDTFGQLHRSLESYNIDIQRAAVAVLGWMKREEAVLPLLRIGSDEGSLGDAVCEALEDIGWRGLSAQLTAFHPSTGQSRALMARALGGILHPPGHPGHPPEVGRVGPVGPVGRVGRTNRADREGVARALLPFLSDEEPSVRAQALLSLGRIYSRAEASPDVLKALIRGLDDGDEDVQKAADHAFLYLERPSRPRALEVLISLPHPSSVILRKNALEVVGKIGGKGELHHLLFSLKDESPDVRRSALHALASVKFAEALDSIKVTLTDEDPQVRVAAAQTLGEIGGRRALEPLGLALKDEDPQVRCAVLRALRMISGPGPDDPLRSALSDPHPMVAITAIEALRERGEGEFLRGLRKMLSHPEAEVRLEAVRSLARIQGKEAIHALSLLVKEQDPVVRDEALKVRGPHRW